MVLHDQEMTAGEKDTINRLAKHGRKRRSWWSERRSSSYRSKDSGSQRSRRNWDSVRTRCGCSSNGSMSGG